MSNLADVVKTLFGVRKTVTEIGAQIKAAQARIEHLKKSPPPRSDLIALFFKKNAHKKRAKMTKKITFF